ncbi:MAG: AMP-binding protein [Acidimicrobiia bacterium]
MIDDARTLWELVDRRAELTPDALFAVDEDERHMSFSEYRAAAERAAAGLAGVGVAEGAPVSWILPTWIESAVLVAALARLGAVQNPMLPIYREREVGFITRQTGASLLICPSEWAGFDFEGMSRGIAGDVDGLEVLVADRTLPEGDPASLPAPPPVHDSRDDDPVRWVFYTSGTTADPKGARHTDRTVMHSAYAMVKALELTPDDRNALVFPFTHIGGIGWLDAGLMVGFPQIVIEAFNPATTIPVLAREHVTIAGAGTPFHMAYLAAQREDPDEPIFPDVRAFPGGGAAKPPQLHGEVKAELGGAGVVSGYGLTECPILAMGSIHDPDEKLSLTEGRPTPGVEVRIVTLDGTDAGTGEEGEIRAKGPQLFRGYLDSSLDADAFDDRGFFRTGDLGNQDDEGYISITGRLKDIIIRKGENISAKEVEDLLFDHPAVADVAVIGLPDATSGERACAVVVVEDGAEPPTLDGLFRFLTDAGLTSRKAPEQLEVVASLPRNPTGKVLKHELRETFTDEG